MSLATATESDAVDLLMSSIICGAQFDAALGCMMSFLEQEGLVGARAASGRLKPYSPRHDPAGWTPRLPEKEWLPLTGQIYRRDGYLCAYCKTVDGQFEIDHIVPVTRGGSNDPDNLCVACKPCNSSKGDRLLSEWHGRYK
ncbi:HNH endonuclease [Bosea sp. AK1]|uniref:HNH endonuclease n=1 Tax=Bosea sp. AK1 TaxID=2587160 RepID=UPI001153BDD9|nr:HNH endonuclease [Bosea sp. AK1]TQI72931.1 HNH endonuclease [Bosea sp. AK1]